MPRLQSPAVNSAQSRPPSRGSPHTAAKPRSLVIRKGRILNLDLSPGVFFFRFYTLYPKHHTRFVTPLYHSRILVLPQPVHGQNLRRKTPLKLAKHSPHTRISYSYSLSRTRNPPPRSNQWSLKQARHPAFFSVLGGLDSPTATPHPRTRRWIALAEARRSLVCGSWAEARG